MNGLELIVLFIAVTCGMILIARLCATIRLRDTRITELEEEVHRMDDQLEESYGTAADIYDGSLDHLDGPQMVAHINEVMDRVGLRGYGVGGGLDEPEPTHYVLQSTGNNSHFFVKERLEIREWGIEWGDDWSKAWIPVVADSIEDARAKAPAAWRESR